MFDAPERVIAGPVDADLEQVRAVILDGLRRSAWARLTLPSAPSFSGGKLLRSRLVVAVGGANAVPRANLHRLAAAVEMIHSASLLHDDVLDGGVMRRGQPAFWVENGVKAAVLVGDMLVSQAVGLVHATAPALLPALIDTMRQMCEAEAEQELTAEDNGTGWERCLSIARGKTGSLFGFAACCGAPYEPRLTAALREAGSRLGTAYQVADDLQDVCAEPEAAGKTLGSDARSGKLTAVTAGPEAGVDPLAYIAQLGEASLAALADWPAIRAAWADYLDRDLRPVLGAFTRGFLAEAPR